MDSRFKIQGSEKISSIPPVWIQGFKIQDLRLRKNFFNPTSLDSRFKVQYSRFKAQKKLLQSNLFGFKIQDSMLKKNHSHLFGFKMQDSRFKAQKKRLQSNLFGFKIRDSRLFNPTCLDSRFKIQGSEKTFSIPLVWIQGFKIQDLRLRKNFFNPTSLDSRFKTHYSRFKVQKKKMDSRFKIRAQKKKKNFFNPTSLDSRFKIQGSSLRKKNQSNLFGFKIRDSRLFNPTCLDSRFKIQGSEKTFSIPPVWIQGLKIQDLRLRKKLLQSNLFGFKIRDSRLFNPTCLDSRFKIQGSEKTFSIPPVWIQGLKIQDLRLRKNFSNPTSWDSRFKTHYSRFKAQKKLLQSNLCGFKIQNSGSEKKLLQSHLFGSKIQGSRFKAQKKLLQSNLFWIQDSRLRKNFFNPTSVDSRFNIQGSEKTSSTPPVWIQDSRFKAQKKLLQSNLCGFKIQDSRLRKNFLNPRG